MIKPIDPTRIETLSSEGEGIARCGNATVFVPGALPGDLVRGEADFAKIPIRIDRFELLENSTHRCGHPCPHHEVCRGSILGGLEYAEQCEHKRRALIHTLRQLQLECILPMVPSPLPWHYRQRVTLSVWNQDGQGGIGYKAGARQQQGIVIQQCKLAVHEVDAGVRYAAKVFQQLVFERQPMPLRMQIHQTLNGAGALLTFGDSLNNKLRKDWQRRLETAALSGGIWIVGGSKHRPVDNRSMNAEAAQAEPMTTSWLGKTIVLHPAAFCQSNHGISDLICRALQEHYKGSTFRRIWDLYGGWGMLSLSLADRAESLEVVELSASVKHTAERLAESCGVRSFRFVNEPVSESLKARAVELTGSDLVILDPPFSGAHTDLLELLGRSPVRSMAYLSCNPARLARDLLILKAYGFWVRAIHPFDMFPQTPRVEALAFLERK